MHSFDINARVFFAGDQYTIITILPFSDNSYYYELRAESTNKTIFLLLLKEDTRG